MTSIPKIFKAVFYDYFYEKFIITLIFSIVIGSFLGLYHFLGENKEVERFVLKNTEIELLKVTKTRPFFQTFFADFKGCQTGTIRNLKCHFPIREEGKRYGCLRSDGVVTLLPREERKAEKTWQESCEASLKATFPVVAVQPGPVIPAFNAFPNYSIKPYGFHQKRVFIRRK